MVDQQGYTLLSPLIAPVFQSNEAYGDKLQVHLQLLEWLLSLTPVGVLDHNYTPLSCKYFACYDFRLVFSC